MTSRMIAPAEERLERLQHLAPSVEDADAGGRAQLVAREGVEVRPERGHVDRKVRGRLGAVQEDPRARRLRALDDLGHGVDRAEHVRDVGQRHEPGPAGDEALERLEVEGAFLGHGDVAERSFRSRASRIQGTRFEWCSISDRRISSPSTSARRAQVWTTRLMASVVPL